MPETRRRSKSGARAVNEHAPRVKRLRSALKTNGFDSLLVTNPKDIRYLTGFHGDASALLVLPKKLIVISDFRFQEELELLKGFASVVIRSGTMLDAQSSLIGDLKLKALALQSEVMTVETRNAIAKAVGPKRVRDSSGLLRGLRIIKDEHEIKLIRKAVGIQQDSLLALRKQLKLGMTEREVAARLEYEMKVRGAEEPAFSTIAAAQANGSLPHAVPGSTRTAKGKGLLIDWGATVDGYHSDMTRTFSFGRWSPKMHEVYEVVLEAHLAAIAAVRPGKTCAEIDMVARDIITEAGYGKEFGHALGHGIGLDVHEDPRVHRTTKTKLLPGMVITIEPGIYLPGIGGVRIEDDVLVTARGGESLCSLPKDIHWATL